MRSLTTLSFLTFFFATTHAQYKFVPVHGCEWITEFSPLTNFTLYLPTSTNATRPASLSFYVSLISTTCTGTSTDLSKFGVPSARTNIACSGGGSKYNGTVVLSPPVTQGAPSNATMTWSFYAGCAADIFEFGYRAVVDLSCAPASNNATSIAESEGGTSCVASGNATAAVVFENYLPPVRWLPPPPPFQYIPPATATSSSSSSSSRVGGVSTVVATATSTSSVVGV